ncbi:alpha/beta fold hydrolase [Salinibacterium sp. SWN167]|uniref:alpha/beta fold hydrolase n=1 Tax=Salinibacterium sp. SWN167 TaxID=2792054 RepID=UPI0018CE56FB|nr:alpha/beta hydrolase [Salinibacterium sp. SWN167]MBH0084486.1 alpha/beta hydrolase [Salinibacterium sp. SWN167]
MATLLTGIVQHSVTTPRIVASVLERPSDTATSTVVFVHGNVSSSLFWQPTMLALDSSVRALAIDLRGFGDSETLPVDATRGVRDFSDDIASVLDALSIESASFVGWSLGGGIVMQFMLDYADRVETVSLVSPVSPYGFGGTKGANGELLNPECSGTGGGGANPEFVAQLNAGDAADESPTSARSVFRTAYVADAAAHTEHEDLWIESMLTTATGEDNYPGDSVAVDAWPGFGPGGRGVLNTMTPNHFNVSAITELPTKPRILWVRGLQDAIVSDASGFDLNFLGQLGVIPGWPGAEVAPPQPMIEQTRAVLEQYKANGGEYTELAWENCGHSAHLERPEEFVQALTAHLGAR